MFLLSTRAAFAQIRVRPVRHTRPGRERPMRSSLIAVVPVIAAAITASSASADILLGTFESTMFVQNNNGSDEVNLQFGYSSNVFPFQTNVLEAQDLGFLDVANGTVTDLTGDFAGFAPRVTNGVDEVFRVTMLGDQTTMVMLIGENTSLTNIVNPGGPDFFNYDLTRVTVMPTSWQGSGGGAQPFTVTIGFVVSFYGNPVPSPGAGVLIAGAGLVAWRRRRG